MVFFLGPQVRKAYKIYKLVVLFSMQKQKFQSSPNSGKCSFKQAKTLDSSKV